MSVRALGSGRGARWGGRGRLRRVILGGGPVITTEPGATPTPPPTIPGDADPSAVVLLMALVMGVVGYIRGAGREFWSMSFTIATYIMIEWQWDFIVHWTNRIWETLFGKGPLIPPDSSAPIWQIAFFMLGVLIGYGVSYVIGRPPPSGVFDIFNLSNMVQRIIGALFGAITGYLIGMFLLTRLLPDAYTVVGPESVARSVVSQVSPWLLFLAFVVIVIFGVLSLGGRKKKVFT